MKALKLALVATFVAFAMVTVANADGFKSKPKPIKVVNLTLEKAMTIPGLVAAMYAQIDKDELLNGTQHIYVAEVTYNGTLYRINGTLLQWIRFFRLQGDPPININGPVFGHN
jgi:hypothetical protein